MTGSRKRRGFTPVELLVLAGVVGLLVAVVPPVIFRVRASGRRGVCEENLGALGKAMASYAKEKGSLPGAGSESDPAPDDWVRDGTKSGIKITNAALYSFVNTPAAYRCPADGLAEEKGLSYAMQDNMDRFDPNRTKIPDRVFLLIEEGPALNDGRWPVGEFGVATRHLGHPHVLLLDGHVEALTAEAFDAFDPRFFVD